jgi:hypothetical protein
MAVGFGHTLAEVEIFKDADLECPVLREAQGLIGSVAM